MAVRGRAPAKSTDIPLAPKHLISRHLIFSRSFRLTGGFCGGSFLKLGARDDRWRASSAVDVAS